MKNVRRTFVILAVLLALVLLSAGAVAAEGTSETTVTFTIEGLDGPLLSGGVNFSVTTKVDGETPEGNYRYKIKVTKDEEPLAEQKIYYDDALPPFVTDEDGVTWFGPPDGFALEDVEGLTEEGATTPFKTNLDPGTYKLELSLVGIADGKEVVLGEPLSHEFAVYDYDLKGIGVDFAFALIEPGEFTPAGDCSFTVNAKVTGIDIEEEKDPAKVVPLRYKITVWKDGKLLSGLEIKYPEAGEGDDPENWSSYTVEDGVAWFGPKDGFTLTDLGALLDTAGVTTPFLANLAAGDYKFQLELVDLKNNVTWGEGETFYLSVFEEIKSIEQKGEELEFDSGVVITIPEAASGEVAVTRYQDDDRAAPAGMIPVGIYLKVECSTGLKGQAARIVVSYDRDGLPKGVAEDDLRLYCYTETGWVLLDDQGIDKAEGVLWANLVGFSEFGVFADDPGVEEPVETPKEDMPQTDGGLSYSLLAGLFMLLAGLWLVREKRLQG